MRFAWPEGGDDHRTAHNFLTLEEVTTMERRTGFVWHEKYAWFDIGQDAVLFHSNGYSIQPDRHVYDLEVVRRFRGLLEVSGLLEQLAAVAPRFATDAELERVHPRTFIETVKQLSALP